MKKTLTSFLGQNVAYKTLVQFTKPWTFYSVSVLRYRKSKRSFRFIKRFYKPKTSKKCKGVLFDKIRKFSRKNSHSAEKNQRALLSLLYFWKHKKLWFSARIETTLSGFRKLVELEQMNNL